MQGKKRKILKKILLRSAVGFIVGIVALAIYFIIMAVDHPPMEDDLSSLRIRRIRYGENAFVLGNNWMRKSESGLWEAYIEGRPFERGVAFGRLSRELLYYQEKAFVEQIMELIPSPVYLRVLKYFIAFFNRNLDKNIPAEFRHEIYGTSFSCSPEFDFIGSGYQRQLNYHAAHDIGHALKDLNMVGCTSFSVWDGSSADSSLLVGRNFDFYMGKKFSENKIVCFVNPSSGYKFMMVTWADLVGVVSGMNDQGLTVTLNAAKSDIPRQAAMPVTLLAREILQYASTIEEAYRLSRKRKLFVSESLMIGSARDGKTAIIEKSTGKSDLVYPDVSMIICTNHYQGSVFSRDENNIGNIRGSDSRERYQRVHELLIRNKPLDVAGAITLLRDRRGLGDSEIGMGNQLAINQLIAHHSVVFKPDSLLVWVSAGPWQSGKFIMYDLNRIFNMNISHIRKNREIYTPSRTVAADTFLASPDYRKYENYLVMTLKINNFIKNQQELPEGFETEYMRSNPSLHLTYSRLGDYFAATGEYKKAHSYYQTALGLKLPGKDEENSLKEKAARMHKKINHD